MTWELLSRCYLLVGLSVLGPTVTACQPIRSEAPIPGCDPDNGGITLPPGFCAVVVAESVGPARHVDVAENGDVLVALNNSRGPDRALVSGGVAVLRDTDGDGRADERHRFGENGGNEVLLSGDFLFFATDDAVLRYPFPKGST